MTYLRDCWYMAAWADELDRPLARTLLDEPVVLYRDAYGAPNALFGRCPHRFAPLSIVRIEGQAVACLSRPRLRAGRRLRAQPARTDQPGAGGARLSGG